MTAPGSPTPIDLLLTGGVVVSLNAAGDVFYPGSVAVSGGVIVGVGPSDAIDHACAPRETLRLGDHAVLPGLINIHGHASNSLIRGLGADLPLHDWLEQVCWPCMNRADDEDVYNGVQLSALEMLLNGVTTFADMWPGVGLAAEAVAATGQRALLAHNIKDFGSAERGERELTTAHDAWQRWHGHAGGRVMVGLGPHSVYTCERALLATIAEIARRDGIHLQIHGCETALEVEQCRARYGLTPIQVMAEAGLLGPHTVVAHAVHLADDDFELLRESGSALAHNVASNLKLASGIAPVDRSLKNGLCVGLGTDGPGSNDGLDLLADLKWAALVQKTATGDAANLPAATALRMATTHGARALGMAAVAGSLEVGKAADLIAIDLDQPRFAPRHTDLPASVLSHLVYVATGADVDTVIVAGKLLVAGGQPLYLDQRAIIDRAQRSSRKILAAAGLI